MARILRPYEAKRIKKSLGGLWKSVRKDLEEGRPPARKDAGIILSLCSEYETFVDPEWRREWNACSEAISTLLEYALGGETQKVRGLLATIHEMERGCHKRYKD